MLKQGGIGFAECGCCGANVDISLLVDDDDFGTVCVACDLAMMDEEIRDERVPVEA